MPEDRQEQQQKKKKLGNKDMMGKKTGVSRGKDERGNQNCYEIQKFQKIVQGNT